MATCPECDADIDVDEFDVERGDVISCPECGSNLEVAGVSPLELQLVDDEDDEEEDEEFEEEEDEEADEDEQGEDWEE
jgi:alpha-aminoadipate carrier protein LysW